MCLQSTEKRDIPKSGYVPICREIAEFLCSAHRFPALASSLCDLPDPGGQALTARVRVRVRACRHLDCVSQLSS